MDEHNGGHVLDYFFIFFLLLLKEVEKKQSFPNKVELVELNSNPGYEGDSMKFTQYHTENEMFIASISIWHLSSTDYMHTLSTHIHTHIHIDLFQLFVNIEANT